MILLKNYLWILFILSFIILIRYNVIKTFLLLVVWIGSNNSKDRVRL